MAHPLVVTLWAFNAEKKCIKRQYFQLVPWYFYPSNLNLFYLSICYLREVYLHTYIIGHYNPSVRIIDLVSHTSYVGCVNFIQKWRQVDSERQIFEKLFMAIWFTLGVFARNLLRGYRRRNTFRILFWCLACVSNPGFSSNKPTNYLLPRRYRPLHHMLPEILGLFLALSTIKST